MSRMAVVAWAAADGLQAEAHDAPPVQELPPEDQKAHQLAQRRGQRRARDAHLEDEMNSGSSPTFRSPPTHMPYIESVASPSARRTLLSTNDAHMTGAPAG